MDELTTTSNVKMREYAWFIGITADLLSDYPELADKPWTSYKNIVYFFKNHMDGIDLNSEIEDGGRVEIGQLQDTDCTIYATFDTGDTEGSMNNNHILTYETSGALRIKLVAQPIKHTGYFTSTLVREKDMTDKHGLTGLVPCAEVLDWGLVEFEKKFASATIIESYQKVLKHLLTKCGWKRY